MYYILDYYNQIKSGIQTEIKNESDEYILGADTNELAKYHYEKNKLSPIEFDAKRKEDLERIRFNERIPPERRRFTFNDGQDFVMESEKVIVRMPIKKIGKYTPVIKDFTGPGMILNKPVFDIGNEYISFEIQTKGYQFEFQEDRIMNEINKEKERINNWANSLNQNIAQQNGILESEIVKFIQERKDKIKSDKEKLESLIRKVNIPLRQKVTIASQIVSIEEKPIVKRIKPSAASPEEYVLNRERVLDIIEIIDNQGDQFEKTPESYKMMAEENLRDILLVNLNTIFSGAATGETFSKKGKTDIYLNIKKGAILIMECKFWKGKDCYWKAINQLLKYLTWRNNFGIIITFSKIKEFSKILSDIENIIINHKSYMSNFGKIKESHFSSLHYLPQDKNKTVEIHHLFYNIYTE